MSYPLSAKLRNVRTRPTCLGQGSRRLLYLRARQHTRLLAGTTDAPSTTIQAQDGSHTGVPLRWPWTIIEIFDGAVATRPNRSAPAQDRSHDSPVNE